MNNIPVVIKDKITLFQQSKEFDQMKLGVNYFNGENDYIMDRKKQFFYDGCTYNDPYRANHKLGSLYNRILIKQLTGYLLGKGIQFQSEQDVEDLKATLGKKFDKIMKNMSNEAGKKAVAWLHPYIKNGKFELMMIPSEQVIPIYDVNDVDNLIEVIRYYKTSFINATTNKAETVLMAEYWDAEKVTYYREIRQGSMQFEMVRDIENPRFHFAKQLTRRGETVTSEGYSFGKVPFIPLWFNDEKENQLRPIKRFIDMVDLTLSDFANNVDDFQDVFWVLKNYEGENVQAFMEQVKAMKTLRVGEDGDARAETIQIPVEAREKLLQILNDKIFTFGQGVDFGQVGDGNITNVVIRSRYANLDLKADEFEGQIEDFFEQLMYFVNKWHSMQGLTVYEDVTPIMDRTLIINSNENMEALKNQKGIISDITIWENHPLVNDVEAEIDRMKEQETIDLDSIGVDSDESDL